MMTTRKGISWICIAAVVVSMGYFALHNNAFMAHILNPDERNTANETVSAPALQSAAQGNISGSASSGAGITAIGDSVMLDIAPYLREMLPGIVIDGKVGRQMRQAEDTIKDLEAQGKLGDQVILELGTNGPFNKKQLHATLSSLGDTRQIYLVNARVPRDWQDTVNESIASVAKDFDNVTLVDWYTASANKDELFSKDGVHLQPDGSQYYASLLVKALKD